MALQKVKDSMRTFGVLADARLASLDSPVITGTLSVVDEGTVTHTIANWSDDVSYTITPTNCTAGAVNASGQFVITHTSGVPSYTIKATTSSLGLADSAVVTKNLTMQLTAPTLSSPANVGTAVNVVYTITSTTTNDDKIILDPGTANFTYHSVSVGTASKVGNTVECIGFTTNNPAVTIQFTAEATYSVTAKSVNIAGTYGTSADSAADSITIENGYYGHFLVVAGGGATGWNGGGAGAGAGGLRTSWAGGSGGGAASQTQALFQTGVVYTCTVGGGGVGIGVSKPTGYGTTMNGGVSSITGSGFTTITTTGGGHGGWANVDASYSARDGGSGGGEGQNNRSGVPTSGVAGEGFGGATSTNWTSTPYGLGGGGGAGLRGGDTTNYIGSRGGAGKQVNIDGNNWYWAGGGGGGSHGSNGDGQGGIGGGGGGAVNATVTGGGSAKNAGGNGGTNSAATGAAGRGGRGGLNTGGGGGGSGDACTDGENGGSGIVIIRVPAADITGGASPTTTGAAAVTTVGSDTVITFTGLGTFTG